MAKKTEQELLREQKVNHAKDLRRYADRTRERNAAAIAKAEQILRVTKDPGTKVEQQRNINQWRTEITDAENGATRAEKALGITPPSPGPKSTQSEADQVAAFRAGERASAGLPAPASLAAPAPPPPAPVAPPVADQPPSDPREFQRYLNTRGAGLVVDGIIGPKTRAAAQRLDVPVPGSVDVQPSRAAAPAVGPAQALGATVVAPPPPPANLGSIEDQIRRNFGFMAWAIDDPEIGPILRRAVSEQWDAAMLQGAVTNTTLWKTTSAAQRQWRITTETDPATADNQRQAMTAQINNAAAKAGIRIAPNRVGELAEEALKNGWTPASAQFQQAIGNEFHYQPGAQQGTIGAAEGEIRRMAASYYIKISDPTLAEWDARVARGEAAPEVFREYIVTQAKSLFPAVAKQLDAGLTMEQLSEPYRQTAADELGVAPDSIDFLQPQWMRALSSTDPKTGQPSMMGLYDWQKALRSDPVYGWDRSANGIAAGYAVGNTLAQALGLRPS